MPFADINGQRVHYTDTGGDGDAIVFSHGFFMSHAMFAPQVEALRDRYRCITWDQRGHGQTVTTPEPFSFWDSSADLLGLLDQLQVDEAVLAGMSQGGFLSLRAALTHPERVRGLVLLDTQPAGEPPEMHAAYDQLIGAWASPGGPPQEVVDTVHAIILGPTFEDRSWVEAARKLPPDTVNQIYNTLMSRDDLRPRIDELTMPALVVHGVDDAAIGIGVARWFADALPNAELVEVPGAGHAANLTHPDIVTPAIEEFLAGLWTANDNF